MAPEKLLAEWFWIDRWMGSRAFGLPLEARGLYREMLSQAWRRGAQLPNDHQQIQRITGITSKEWKRAWPLVEQFWRVDGASLVNDTQLEVYADAKRRSEKASERGLRGAQARAQALLKQSASTTQAQVEHKPPSPISDLRSPSPERARDRAPHYPTAPIIGRNPHLGHAFCDADLSYCVPAAVHHKLADLIAPRHGGDRDAAKAALQAWYPTVTAKIVPGFVMGDAFKFWQGRFDADFATPDTPKRQRLTEDSASMVAGVREILRKQGVV